jgi:hypothetical protein
MSYDSTRTSEQLRVLRPEILNFIARYNASSGPGGIGPRQTVFFFPGGMASRLVRAKTAYQPGVAGQVFDYDELWLNLYTFFAGRARDLKMTRLPGWSYRDKGNKIIVTDGLINFLGVTPYVGFTAWCEFKNVDYFVFPWDWRRSIWDVGSFFINDFLPYFQDLVKAGCLGADPLARFSLIGHSAGGMLVNWALRSSRPIMGGLDQAITVATPFYGYGGQVHRWFEGEPFLNFGNQYRAGIISAICSFPGCYAWMFLPHPIYLANAAAFATDPNYPLAAYPSADAGGAGIVDPYNPLTTGPLHRYPAAVDDLELAIGKILVTVLASSLGAKANKLWNIRGDTLAGNTLNTTEWDWVPPTWPSPITDVSVTAGDSVQPGWTTRHLDAMPGHVITIPFAPHALIMNSPLTIAVIAGILGIPLF